MDLTPAPQAEIRAVLFDKDGTLFDFRATWEGWAANVIRGLSAQHGAAEDRLAAAVGFDLAASRFAPDSPVIAGTNDEVAALLAAELAGVSPALVAQELAREARRAPVAPAVPLGPCLGALRHRGLRLGVMTNDAEAVAHAHMATAGIADQFDFIAGFDSGHGAKPEPGPLLAFADAMGLAPAQVVMVGDSTHDLIAARAAGMTGIGVLTGLADRKTLSAHAAAVLPDIGHLEAWIFG